MRISTFLFILFSVNSYAQLDTGLGGLGACTQGTAGFQNGGTYECSSLTLSGSPPFIPAATALIIKVTGTVTISGAVSLNGAPGPTNASFSGSVGGDGGPGAGNGGGDDSSGNQLPGSDASQSSGDNGAGNGTCGDGGGGAGFIILGSNGLACVGGVNSPGAGGAIAAPGDFDLNTNFRGGFGGGAAGDSGAFVYGAGGGGGGALHIIAGGNVVINAGGSITADGGDGGNGGPDGGGGGAGSGGVIWIQTLGQITYDGLLTANGGNGGLVGAGGLGGNGSYGIVRLEDGDGIIDGIGILPPYATQISVNGSSSTPSLKSDIACGTIAKPSEKQNLLFQMMIGFILASMFGMLCNLRRRHR